MDIRQKRKIVAILNILAEVDRPMGSISISQRLAQKGIDLRERMIRYYLEMTDKQGLTENLHRQGRIITEKGRKATDFHEIILTSEL